MELERSGHNEDNDTRFIAWHARKQIAQLGAAHEPPPAAAVLESSETMNTKPESDAPVDGGGR